MLGTRSPRPSYVGVSSANDVTGVPTAAVVLSLAVTVSEIDGLGFWKPFVTGFVLRFFRLPSFSFVWVVPGAMTAVAARSRKVTWKLDGRVTELTELPVDEPTLFRLFTLLFKEHATELTFGPCIEGAVFEIHVDQGPGELTMCAGRLSDRRLRRLALPSLHRRTSRPEGRSRVPRSWRSIAG